MSGTVAWGIFLGMHILGCAVVWVMAELRFIRLEHGCFPVVLFVPLWGPLSAVLLDCRPNASLRWTASGTLYEHKKTFRALPQDAAEHAAEIVPLEEALLLDSPAQRRRLMLLLLRNDPSRYCDLLELARRSRDSEVVHYAAAAEAQMNKQADLQLQTLHKRCQAQPQNMQIAAEYRQQLQRVLWAGIVRGQAARFWLRQLEDLLQKEWQAAPEYTCGCQLAKTQMALQKNEAAEQTLAALTEHWPQREAAWLLRLHCAAARRDGAAVQAVLRSIQKQRVYLSTAGREAVHFWQEDRDHETVF